MRQKRILIASAFTAFFKQGGGEAEAASLCDYLNNTGLHAEIYGPHSPGLETFDLVIFFSCHHSGLELLDSCREYGINFVLWPNFWPQHDLITGSEMIATAERLAAGADKVIFKSQSELNIFSNIFQLDPKKALKINWFIDPEFLTNTDQDRFKAIYELNDFVLSVGLIEVTKNQLRLINAAKSLGISTVLIGGYRNKAYFEECQKAAGETVTFIPHLPPNSHILRSAYAACRVYAEVSFDPPGRSAIEALSQGKPLILPKGDWSQEICGDLAVTADPKDERSIENALRSALNRKSHFTSQKSVVEAHFPKIALNNLLRYIEQHAASNP